MKYEILTVTILTMFLGSMAFGEARQVPGGPAKQVARKRVASARRPAATDIRTTARAPRPPKAWDLRLTAAGGYAQLDSNDSTEQASRNAASYNRNAYVGLGADIALYQYLGAEVEGYYGFGGNGQTTSVDRFQGKILSDRKSLKQYGGMGDVQGRLPFNLGKVKIIPRAGVGYGWLNVEHVSEGDSGPSSVTTSLTGAYVTGGAEIRITPEFSIQGDYAVSLGGSSSEGASSIGGRFDRVRAGLSYKVADLSLGTQYLRRQLKSDAHGTTPELSETTSQVLGTIGVSF